MDPTSNIENAMFTTIRIETIDNDGKEGSATGFLFWNRVDEEKGTLFLVTNRHVIENTKKATYHVIKKKDNKPWLGEALHTDDPNPMNRWFFHPDPEIDVAITPFIPILKHFEKEGGEIFYRNVRSDLIPSKEVLDDDIDAIEDIIFIGYPKGLHDEINYTPIIRKGITATPVYIDFNGKKQFLIDASIFPGSSGSPVFLNDTNIHFRKKDMKPVDSRYLFLGIVSEGYLYEEENKIVKKLIPVKNTLMVKTEQMIDIGIVYKSQTIVECIEKYMKNMI